MNCLSAKLSLFLIVLLGSQPLLSAQGEGPGGQGVNVSERAAARRKMAEKRDKKSAAGDVEQADERKMTPEELLEASKRRGSRGQCRFVAAMRPPKLLPGQSGTLLVTAILQGRSVLPAPSQVRMTQRTPPDFLTLGDMTARPAPVGTIHEGYRGRPVYENTAVFEVPVTVSSKAKLGDKVSVAVDLEFDIHDGDSTRAVGRFIERVKAEFEVAPYVDPPVAPVAEPVEVSASDESAESAPAPSMAPSTERERPDVLTGADTAAAAPSSDIPEEDLPAPTAMPRPSGGFALSSILPMLIGGVVVLLAVVLLIARKR